MNYIKEFCRSNDRTYLQKYYASDHYVQMYSKPKPEWTRKFNIIAQMMKMEFGTRVLDVGCASKMFRPYTVERGGIYKGLDISPGFQPDYLCDAENMDAIGDNEFDWVVLSDVLEHLPNPTKALRESRRVGLNVIAVLPNWYHLDRFTFLPHHPNDRHLVRMSPHKWINMFRQVGFKIVRVRGFFYVPSIAFRPLPGLGTIDRFLRECTLLIVLSDIIDERFSERPVVRFLGQEIIVVATKP